MHSAVFYSLEISGACSFDNAQLIYFDLLCEEDKLDDMLTTHFYVSMYRAWGRKCINKESW